MTRTGCSHPVIVDRDTMLDLLALVVESTRWVIALASYFVLDTQRHVRHV